MEGIFPACSGLPSLGLCFQVALLCVCVALNCCYHLSLASGINPGLGLSPSLPFLSPCPYRCPTAAQASLAPYVNHAQGV